MASINRILNCFDRVFKFQRGHVRPLTPLYGSQCHPNTFYLLFLLLSSWLISLFFVLNWTPGVVFNIFIPYVLFMRRNTDFSFQMQFSIEIRNISNTGIFTIHNTTTIYVRKRIMYGYYANTCSMVSKFDDPWMECVEKGAT